MSIKPLICATSLALGWLGPSVSNADAEVPKPSTDSTVGVVSGQKFARLTPGVSTKTDVQSLLGPPWRTVQYNDMEELEDEIWEYRGTDSSGPYRIHIEFDPHDVVRIVGKIPDKVPGGRGTDARIAPGKSAVTPKTDANIQK